MHKATYTALFLTVPSSRILTLRASKNTTGYIKSKGDVRDQHECTTSYAAAKLGPLGDLEREYERYEKFVSPVLPVGGFAHVIKFTETYQDHTFSSKEDTLFSSMRK